jgi:shikimate dehydrogenase
VETGRVEEAVRGVRALGFRGVNVTVPHKAAVIPFLDEIAPAARAIGAVNTIVVEAGGRLVGHNTDAGGFLADLAAQGVEPAGRRALVLGAGGAARAVVYALATTGAVVTIASRRAAQAQQLIVDLQAHVGDAPLRYRPLQDPDAAPGDLIVNATPVGMSPRVDEAPWPGRPLPRDCFVYDLIYNPAETVLMRRAREAGGAAANGLGMLVQQGALAFELWLGEWPDVQVMYKAAR